ncbi:class I SAM-dependent methyltransferase [Psychroserpens mesophilus]|uniref:class I SAM-dependent methyltransferase n=1 Tax=Psychroserpens mesophilus TaxID=325473 RepID=UPI003D660731
MTWEETIEYIRKDPEYTALVEHAYFDENLELNVSRFESSLEFVETLNLIKTHAPNAKTILDIGCGNGISTISFAKKGYQVTAVEPDPSKTVGAGAIQLLKDKFALKNVDIHVDFAENINFPDDSFDVVYVRQAMHHANNLNKFVEECIRVLKPNGLLLTIRDHVIINDKDKAWFLKAHPLHKFYGGENAYTSQEYRQAIKNGGATIFKELKFYDSVINYFPKTDQEIAQEQEKKIAKRKKQITKKIGLIGNIPLFWWMYKRIKDYNPLDENEVPGRMYSYIAIKK